MTVVEDTEESPGRPPIFGLLSLISPLVGVALAYVCANGPSSEAGWGIGGAVLIVGICSASIVFGFIASIVGMVRRERFIVLAVIGLVLNIIPVLYFFAFLN